MVDGGLFARFFVAAVFEHPDTVAICVRHDNGFPLLRQAQNRLCGNDKKGARPPDQVGGRLLAPLYLRAEDLFRVICDALSACIRVHQRYQTSFLSFV